MSKQLLIWILLLLSYYPILLIGQNTILQDYVKEGLSNNLQLQKNALGLQKQTYKVAEAKSNTLPLVTFEPSYLLSAGGRHLDFPIGDFLNPAYQTLNSLTQSNDFPTDLENVNEQLTPNNFHDTRVYASYPLFNRAIYYNLKAQEQLISVEQAKITAYEVELTKEIKVAYYNYFKTFEVISVLAKSNALLKELFRFNQKLVKYDKATPDVLSGVTYEIEKLNSTRVSILQQQHLAKTYFNSLLNRAYDAEIEKSINLELINFSPTDLDQLKEEAITNRSELIQINNAKKATELITQLEEKSKLPTIGLQGSAGFQGSGYLFKGDQFLATLAIGAKWTIYDGKKRIQKIAQSKITSQELQTDYALVKQQIELQVTNAWYALSTATQKINTEKAAVESAQQRFNLIEKKYKNEQAILIEYLDAQTKLNTAQINLSIAKYDVLIRAAELERAVAY